MSNWSHVAAIARIDGFADEYLYKKPYETAFTTLFGKELNWEDGSKAFKKAFAHPEQYLPLGSEGSLNMTVWKNPNESCMARYTVSIFGDLRDHDHAQEIIDWFKEKLSHCDVRNAVITVTNEWDGTITWDANNDTEVTDNDPA